MSHLYLTPPVAVAIFLGVVICGHNFRRVWKQQAPGWKTRAWIFGVPAALGLLALGFLPLKL